MGKQTDGQAELQTQAATTYNCFRSPFIDDYTEEGKEIIRL